MTFLALISTMIFCLILGPLVYRMAIKVGYAWNLLDVPSSRRRHKKATPIVGGVGVFFTWYAGIAFFCIQEPSWLTNNLASIGVLSFCVLILAVLGVADDLRGLGPLIKLLVQVVAAISVIVYEPNVHAILLHWSETLGFLVWPLGIIWIVGITNAINLVDGLDGLAGGTSFLVASSIFILSIWTGSEAVVGTVLIGLLLPILLTFLRYNWCPAKIFLGDNGSLPLGFLLSTGALMCRPESKSWIMIASVILMLGYPMLDMGQSVLRRKRNQMPLFKADRVHLHYRVMRLGLSVRQTVLLLLSIGLYLQISALAVNLMDPPAAALGISVVIFSICSLLFLIYTIEKARVRRTFQQVRRSKTKSMRQEDEIRVCSVMIVNLAPLLETHSFEQRGESSRIILALELMLSSMLRKEDRMITLNESITVVFSELDINDFKQIAILKQKIENKISQFIDLFHLTGSLSSLPVVFTRKSIIVREGTDTTLTEVA